MALQLDISFEALKALVMQLDEAQKRDLADMLSTDEQTTLTIDDRKALYHSSILSIPVNEEPSIRREDWYDDDGR